MKKRNLVLSLALFSALALVGCGNGVYETKGKSVHITTSTGHNPIAGYSETRDHFYGGDPSVLVDGDTVYLYTGHDMSTDAEVDKAIYNIPEYVCYSTKDMKTWKAEGTVFQLSTKNVKWASDSSTAWAAQVAKHYDKEAGKDMYYLYFCTWDRTSKGKQSIGVAVSDSPTGPFTDIGQPLVKGTLTEPESNAWNDIDPTIWIDKDENGVEHRYMAWGNSKYYICELNEDMISVKDINGDGKITCGNDGSSADIINHQNGLPSFTEAPWIYRRQDKDGNYYGDYYLFYAHGWHEAMAYATTDDLMYGKWNFGSVIMSPTATSNTNHPAVFNFKGKTYFVYHNGMLAAGNGYRRSACITELIFNEDGSVQPMQESTAGVAGELYKITLKNDESSVLYHAAFINSADSKNYPIKNVQLGINLNDVEVNSQWVITKGKYRPDEKAYVSIQAENKPGLYITSNSDDSVTLAQDTANTEDMSMAQTFYSKKGLSGSGVSFESISNPGKYLTIVDGILKLTDGSDKANSTFEITMFE